MVHVPSRGQAEAYAAVSAELIEEGYEDLLNGEPEGVREALAQMILEAEQMMNRALSLKEQLNDADDDAAVDD